MTQYNFGTGTLIAKRTDVINRPPMFFGTLQDLTIDFDQKLEALYGQNKVAVALGDGALSIKGKAKFARIQQTMVTNLLLGTSQVAGSLQMVQAGEGGTIPTTPFQITVANAASTPLADYGVFYQATGVQLTPVASGPTTGQYVFNPATGVYTFAAADTGLAVWLYYTYSASTGIKTTVANSQLIMGTSPTFEVYFKSSTPYFGVAKDITIRLNACKSSKLSLGFNNQKFLIPDFDFECMEDASGNIMTFSTSE